ncbi:MAG: PKD domain-containing protein, partial [Saprospiraceae bacterium]
MAKHIIGGEIFYTCEGVDLGKNLVTFKFTMKIYRDCGTIDGAALDEKAEVGIYVKNSDFDFSYIATELFPLIKRGYLASNNKCVITPPDICVEEGTYEWILTLPIIEKPYFLAYQRCCRNESITNIINPGSNGAAYTIEISPEAQNKCNNSPTFKNFPPIIICAGKDINFDHSAIDKEGDQVTYEFCTPYNVGGIRGTKGLPGDSRSCDGVLPSPSRCRPPFNVVLYKTPFYSINAPMAGNPIVQINPITGLISGSPDSIGQYVVGVCIKEYRNGILLTTIRRDFQFNVIQCIKNVDARISADSILSNNRFVLNACGNKIVNIFNTSTIDSFIRSYSWEFNINGNKQIDTTKNVSLNLPDLGHYTGILYLNKGDVDCSDTAYIDINVFPGIDANYNFAYDTCISGPVQFTDLSTAPQSQIIKWQYLFEPGKTGTEENPSYVYHTPGNKNVLLKITDNNGCVDTITKNINYYPVPSLLVLNPSLFAGCEPLNVFFENLSFPIDASYDILWEFGDGTTSKEISPTHIYKEGSYSVKLTIKSPIGCET